MNNNNKWPILLLSTWCAGVAAQESCNEVFSSPLQSHDGGKLTLTEGVQIYKDPDFILEFGEASLPTYDGYAGHCKAEDDGDYFTGFQECVIDGQTEKLALPTLGPLTPFPAISATKADFLCDWENASKPNALPAGSYDNVTLDGWDCALTLTDTSAPYYIKNLTFKSAGNLVLQNGVTVYVDEYIHGSGSSTSVKDGSATLHINNLAMGNWGENTIAPDEGAQLHLIAYGDWHITAQAQVAGQLSAQYFNRLAIDGSGSQLAISGDPSTRLNVGELTITDNGRLVVGANAELYSGSLVLDSQDQRQGGIVSHTINGVNSYASPVSIFVSGDVQLSGPNESSGHDSLFHGLIYASGDINIYPSMDVVGALSGANINFLDGPNNRTNQSVITYNPDYIPEYLQGDCAGDDAATYLYYRITHDGAGLSCMAEPVHFSAFSNPERTQMWDEAAPVALVPQSGWTHGSDLLTVTGEATSSIWSLGEPIVEVALEPRLYAGEVQCLVNGVVSNDCAIVFNDSGLVMTSNAQDGRSWCGQERALTLQAAVTSASDPQQCDPMFTGVQEVFFSSTGLTGELVLSWQGQTLSLSPTNPSGTLTVILDEQGLTDINYNYNDVGRVQLSASITQTPTDSEGQAMAPITLEGESTLTVIPAGLVIAPVESSAICELDEPLSCGISAQAQQDLSMSFAAVCYQDGNDRNNDSVIDAGSDLSGNAIAKSFRHDTLTFGTELVAPVEGMNNSVTTDVTFNSGQVLQAVQSDEVGVFRWLPQTTVSYLGYAIPYVQSRAVGRFIPAYLQATTNTPLLAGFCGPMTYLDQTTGFMDGSLPELTLRGFGAQGAETTNYVGDYWRFANNLIGAGLLTAYDDQTLSTVTLDSDALETTVTRDDRTMRLDGLTVSYARGLEPYLPHPAALTLTINEALVTDLDGVCVREQADGNCQDVAFTNVGGTEWRDGRIELTSMYGSETSTLTVPVEAQYFNSSYRYQLNEDDSCTVLNATALMDSDHNVLTGRVSGYGSFSAGSTSLEVAGNGVTETLKLEALLLNDNPHLQWWWQRPRSDDEHSGRYCTSAAGVSLLCNPQAQITFGMFRGHDKVIYRREVR